MNELISTTYSVSHYKEYQESGDLNLFEEVIDQMMLDEINPELQDKIKNLPLRSKRLNILAFLDGDRNLFMKIKSYIDNNKLTKMEHLKDVLRILREYVKVGEVEKKKYGEVMTPLSLVLDMLKTLPDEVWSNPNLKWLDPANGTGPYPLMVIYRLMNGLKEWEPDEEKRYKHIIENMIYVCELQPKNMFLYMCLVDPYDEYKMNIYTGSFLEEGFDYHMKNVWGINRPNITLGNPPYQKMDGGAKASAGAIYNLFTEKSVRISDKTLFITPSRWFGGGKGLDSYRKFMMESNKIKSIKHFEDASYIFNNSVDITGGVSYFLYDNNYNGPCIFNEHEIYLNKFDIIIKNIESVKLISRFLESKNISSISNPRSYFGISTNFSLVSDEKSDDMIKCYFSKNRGFIKWVDKKYVKNLDTRYRVATPRANGNYPRFGNIFIVGPNECVSDSYISFYIETSEEADSLLSYLKTKFANYLLSIRKVSQTIKPDTCKWIPIVPFDREWTDEKLFEYFDLTQEERHVVLNYDKK